MRGQENKLTMAVFNELLKEYPPISEANLENAEKEPLKEYKAIGNDNRIVIMHNPCLNDKPRDEYVLERLTIEEARNRTKSGGGSVSAEDVGTKGLFLMSLITKSLGDKVQTFLEEAKATRDNDKELLLTVWATQLGRPLSPEEKRLFRQIADSSEFVVPESVSRARRAIQEMRPELRGKSYQARQDKAEEVRQQGLFNN